MNDELKQQILEILEAHELCVLSTVTAAGLPQAAIVGFSQNANLQLLIGTSNRTRKYANLQQNQAVAVVVGGDAAEVQYEGTVRELTKQELEEHLQTHFDKLPGTAKYLEDTTQAWFLITPTWLRLTVHEDMNVVTEIKDFA
ncbi:MAG: pyridoxamine 5'-phosphate oxidase family protein [Candidatus Saccharimonadales bacterium]